MSRLTAKAAKMSCRIVEAPQRSSRAAEAADWFGRAAEAAQISRHDADAAERSSRGMAAWKDLSRAGDGSHKCMRAMLNDLMDRISGWVKLPKEMNASFNNATGVIWGLRGDKAKLPTEHDLLRAKREGRSSTRIPLPC